MAVKFEQRVEIDASVEAVWSILTDVRTWPLWFPDADRIERLAAVKPDATFSWHRGDDSGAGTVVQVEPRRRLRIITTGDGPAKTHTLELDRAGGVMGMGGNDARLEYTLEYDPPGGFISDFVAGGNPRDLLKVKGTLEKVKAVAEGKADR